MAEVCQMHIACAIW